MIKLLKDIFKKTPDFNKSSLETNPFLIRKMEFKRGMENFKSMLIDHELSKKQRLDVIDMVLQAIRMDIQSDQLTYFLYHSNEKQGGLKDIEKTHSFVPLVYLNKSGESVFIETENYKKTVDLSKDIVVSQPTELRQFAHAARNIANNKFKYFSDNHFGYYYKGLDITFIYNGKHSSSIGIIKKQGTINVKVIDVEKLFDLIDINDNLQYIDVSSGKILDERCIDHRIALLYKISKEKRKYINALNDNSKSITSISKNNKIYIIKKNIKSEAQGYILKISITEFYPNLNQNPISSSSANMYIDNNTMVLTDIFTHTCNRQGFGSLLFLENENVAKKYNINIIKGNIRKDSQTSLENLINFYKKNGCTILKDKEEYIFIKKIKTNS